jgi:hypothetical protein
MTIQPTLESGIVAASTVLNESGRPVSVHTGEKSAGMTTLSFWAAIRFPYRLV